MPVAVLAAVLASLHASAAPALRLDRSKYMGVDQIKPGMQGIGRTVLKGVTPIEFKVSIVDVVRNWGPKQHVILVRCAGANLEHSGIIRGMSGSPIYLHDPADGGKLKMIGAIAYGWQWNKDPVGGVQPIEQMLAVRGFNSKAPPARPAAGQGRGRTDRALGPPQSLPGPPDPSRRSRYAMLGFVSPLLREAEAPAPRQDRPEGLVPLMTPLMVGTLNASVMDYLKGQLAGTRLCPLQAGAGGKGVNPPDRFVPGGSLVIPMLIGDVDMAGVGTVTEVVGDRVLGFGHSMMAEGTVELPMATGVVNTPISMLSASFKLASMGKLAGTLVGDEETGVWGISGRVARMIPTRVVVSEGKQRQTYEYQAMHHRQMTPWILGAGMMMSVLANRDLPQEHTLRYRLSAEYDKLGTFAVSNVSSMNWLYDIRSDLTEPMSMLMDSRFGRARLKGVQVDVSIEPKASAATMERVELIRSEVKPGERVEVLVRWRPYRAKPFVRRYAMSLPEDLPDGTYELRLGSGRSHLMAVRSEKPHLFRVESMSDMMAAVRRIGSVRSDRLYMRLRIKRGGVAVGKTEMPELPSFRQRIFDQAELHAVQAYAEPIVVEHQVPFVVSGERQFAVKVDRRADQ